MKSVSVVCFALEWCASGGIAVYWFSSSHRSSIQYLSFHSSNSQYLYYHFVCYDCYKSIFVPVHHYNNWVYKWVCSLSLSAIWKNSEVQTSDSVLVGECCDLESSQDLNEIFVEFSQ